jgi:hypothetical protein
MRDCDLKKWGYYGSIWLEIAISQQNLMTGPHFELRKEKLYPVV